MSTSRPRHPQPSAPAPDGAPRKRATLKDLAAALGVAPSTVSNAYNRPDQLSQDLRQRILETAREIGYTGPHPVARGLRQQRTGTVGVIFSEQLSYAFRDPVATQFLQGVASSVEAAGLSLLLLPALNGQKPDPATVLQAAVDGFVIYSMSDEHPLITAALERGLPAVLVDQPELPGVPSVRVDDHGGAKAACEHLIALGHRRFGVVSFEFLLDGRSGPITAERVQQLQGPSCPPSRERWHGYQHALEHADIDPHTAMTGFECDRNTPEQGRRAAQHLLQPGVTALLCMSDQLALGALEAIRERGLRVPEDISVVGFDDIPAAAGAHLSTVHQPHLEKGRKAGAMLVARLRGDTAASPDALETRLVVRASSGAAPSR